MPQIGICIVTIINKGIEYWCNFFVVPGIGPALLGMPCCGWIQLVSSYYQTTNEQCKKRQIIGPQKEDK